MQKIYMQKNKVKIEIKNDKIQNGSYGSYLSLQRLIILL